MYLPEVPSITKDEHYSFQFYFTVRCIAQAVQILLFQLPAYPGYHETGCVPISVAL